MTGEVILIKNIDFTLQFQDDIDISLKPKRLSTKSYELIKKHLKNMVENPEDVDLYFNIQNIESENNTTESFSITEIPSLVGSNIDYVIITNEALKEQFKQISDWKTKKGLPAVTRTVEWIYDHYPGCDGAEKIRNFIIDANEKWGTIWFLLGGDDNIIPLRFAWHSPWDHPQLVNAIPDGEFIPTDMYYACLDGNWNADADATFGEGSYDRNNDGTFSDAGDNARIDDVDLGPDVFVGRITVESENELDTFINKYFEYIKESQGNENNVLLFSADSDDINSSEMNYVGNKFPVYTNITKLYENYGHVKEDVLSAFNAQSPYPNFHIICGYGHGSAYSFEACVENIVRTDVDILANPDKSEILYLNHCHTMAWDKDCITEHFLNTDNGGVSVIGNTRFGWTGDPSKYNDDFIDALYNKGYLINDAFYYTKTLSWNIGDAYRDRYCRWGFFALNISSDPEMPIWTDTPQELIVSHLTEVTNGQIDFLVTIENLESNVEAVVCLQKGMEDYAYQPVTGTGSPVTVEFEFTPDTPGDLDVTVTAHNYIPYEDVVPVTITEGVHLLITEKTFDDDDAGLSSGNSNGQTDAGETIELSITLQNTGNEDAGYVTATLSCGSSYINFIQDESEFDEIPAGESVVCQDNYVFEISPNTPDNEYISFDLTIEDGIGTHYDNFYIQISAPELDQVKNNAGEIEPGEDIDLFIKLLNTGNAEATGINAVLSSESEFIEDIPDDEQEYDNIPALNEGVNDDPFIFTVIEDYEGETLEFSLDVTNEYGRQWHFDFDLDTPDPVILDNMDFTGYLNEIDLLWDPVTNIRGYNVYQSSTVNGQFEQLNKFIIEGTSYFKDGGLDERTEYYYKVSTVDVSGNESDLTASFKAWTTLPYLSGWPIIPDEGGRIFGGPTAANVDNDPEKEIFLANKKGFVLGWNPNATELFDIDNNPTTVSGFYDLDESECYATPAIADINKNGKQEIVITTRDGGANPGKIFVFNAEDNNGDSSPDVLWTFDLGGPNLRGVVISDLDGDGYKEILSHKEGGNPIFYILKHNGTIYKQWQINSTGPNYGLPAVVDLDFDGKKEIIEGFANGELYIWKNTGSAYNTNPVFNTRDYHTGAYNIMPPVVADIDKDGAYEIFIMASKSGSATCYLYAITETGQIKDGWNGKAINLHENQWNPAEPPSVSIGDIDQDDNLEIFCAYYGYLKVWNADGTEKLSISNSNFKIYGSSPNIADIDGGGDMEIIVSSYDGNIYAYKNNGDPVTGWPLRSGDPIKTNPVIADVDGGGKSEIITGKDSENGEVCIWKTEGDPNLIEWGHYRHDNQNTGVYNTRKFGVISTNQTWSGVVYVIGNLTVNSDVTLTIKPGTTIKFSDDCALNVYGYLMTEGTEGNPITFTSSRTDPSIYDWEGVHVNTGGYAYLEHCKFEYGTWVLRFESETYGDVLNCTFSDNYCAIYSIQSNPRINDCQIINNRFGFHLRNCYAPDWNNIDISNCTINNNSYFGIYAYDASPTIYNNEFIKNTRGLWLLEGSEPVLDHNVIDSSTYFGICCCNSSNPDIYYNYQYNFGGYNRICGSGISGIVASGNSHPVLGYYGGSYDRGGYNSIYGNSDYEVENNTDNTIYAQLNWWGMDFGNPPQGSPSYYGSVEWYPALSSPPEGEKITTGADDFSVDSSSDLPAELQKAYYEQMCRKYEEAANQFKDYFIDKSESSFAVRSAIEYLKNLDYYKTTDEIQKELEETKKKTKNNDVHFELSNCQITLLIRCGEYKKAIDEIDKNLNTEISLHQSNRLLIQKALVNIYNLNDPKKGEYYLDEVLNNSSKEDVENIIASLEKEFLNEEQNSILTKKLAVSEDVIPKEYQLIGNYPNPFNPVTQIRFTLPYQSRVTVVIFNIMGQHIKTIEKSSLPAGIYDISWNGKNKNGITVSSGLYIYNFNAVSLEGNNKQFDKSSKMLLIK